MFECALLIKTYPVGIVFTVWAFVLCMRGPGHWKRSFASGLLAGLALGSRLTLLPVPLGVLLTWITRLNSARDRLRASLFAALGVLAGLVPVLVLAVGAPAQFRFGIRDGGRIELIENWDQKLDVFFESIGLAHLADQNAIGVQFVLLACAAIAAAIASKKLLRENAGC